MDNDPKHDALRFGKYEVLRDAGGGPMLLGSGSYGRTYKARHLMLGTEVAIKVIRRELTASESTRQRFLREGRALAGLAHDHIALLRYFDCGDDGQLYYAMDYCAGGTLAERVRRRGPRPVGEALEIVRQAASALVAAHAAGIIHRDLKPGNIMLAQAPPPWRVKVIDFGLAQSSGMGAAGGRFHGTAQWASPEQLREAPIDGRSDLFSLGLILWFLLEGAAPDPGDTPEVVQRRLDPGGYAERLPQGLPPDVRGLLGNLLETEPSRRVASAVFLLERLAALCVEHPYQPVAEPDEDTAAGAEAAGSAGLLLENAGDDRYTRMTRLHRDLAGEWFEAELDGGQGQRMVFVLDEHLAEHPGLRDKVRANLARLRRQPVDALPRSPAYYETGGTLVAEFQGTGGGDLASWLRLRRKVDLRDALGFLARLAGAADDAQACGLPGIGLMAVQVRRGSGGSGGSGGGENSGGASLRGAEPRLFPLLLAAADLPPGEAVAGDASGSTLVLATPELACNRIFMLAKLIYRMVSGRETPDAVAHSPGAYITVSALTEQGNAILREALGRSGQWDSCSGLLRALAQAENLPLAGNGSARTRSFSDGSASLSDPPPATLAKNTLPQIKPVADSPGHQSESAARQADETRHQEEEKNRRDKEALASSGRERLKKEQLAAAERQRHAEEKKRLQAEEQALRARIDSDQERSEREWLEAEQSERQKATSNVKPHISQEKVQRIGITAAIVWAIGDGLCPPRRNGNMPAAPERRAIMPAIWTIWPGIIRIQTKNPMRWLPRKATRGDFMTCTAMSGNDVRIGMAIIPSSR